VKTISELSPEEKSNLALEQLPALSVPDRRDNKLVWVLIEKMLEGMRKDYMLDCFLAEIVHLPELSINDADLCVLPGNALDNALEASALVREWKKEVWVFLDYVKGCLFLQVKNYYDWPWV